MPSIENKEIKAIFDAYPKQLKKPMKELRNLIYEVAGDHNLIVEESIKWGEPSFRTKQGSPLRLGVRTAEQSACCIYFNCQTNLVETFRELYSDVLRFEGKREITLDINKDIPEDEVRHCLELALKYHQLKHLPQLGT